MSMKKMAILVEIRNFMASQIFFPAEAFLLTKREFNFWLVLPSIKNESEKPRVFISALFALK